VSEIYDRIAVAGVGRYNEFDQLRRSGVQHADIKGYQFSREDVDARSLANLYAQYMGNVFTHEMKPLEVEILVAEVGTVEGEDQLFHILYDGSVVDESSFTVLGGEADAIITRMKDRFVADWDLGAALRGAAAALSGPDRTLGAGDLEVAVLDRDNGRRAFRRIPVEVAEALLVEPVIAPPLELESGGDPAAEGPVAEEPGTEDAGSDPAPEVDEAPEPEAD
jgi:proteasome alpha subunit